MHWLSRRTIALVFIHLCLCWSQIFDQSDCQMSEHQEINSCLKPDGIASDLGNEQPIYKESEKIYDNENKAATHSWVSTLASYATDAFKSLTSRLLPISPAEPVSRDPFADVSSKDLMKSAESLINDVFDIDVTKSEKLAEIWKDVFHEDKVLDKDIAGDEEVFEYPPVVRRDPGKVGDVKYIEVEKGVKRKLITRSVRPPLFEIPDFLSAEECDYIIEKSREKGLNASTMFQTKDRMEAGENVGTFRESFSSFLKIKDVDDEFLHKLHDKVAALTGMHKQIVQWSENLAIGMYKPGGHYHAHQDSNEASRDKLCCFQTNCTGSRTESSDNMDCCRLCRYVTVLYYLSDVENGGETAFPFADLSLQDMIDKGKNWDWQNLTSHCHDAPVVIKPEKGKAIMWYNHFVDSKGYISAVDKRSFHGGCEVTKGTKWIATNWISTPIYPHRFKPSKYRDIV